MKTASEQLGTMSIGKLLSTNEVKVMNTKELYEYFTGIKSLNPGDGS